MWVSNLRELTHDRQTLNEQGMYMFGGLDQDGKPTDDLYFITFDHESNIKCVVPTSGEYKHNSRPSVRLLARKIEPSGRRPISRS